MTVNDQVTLGLPIAHLLSAPLLTDFSQEWTEKPKSAQLVIYSRTLRLCLVLSAGRRLHGELGWLCA